MRVTLGIILFITLILLPGCSFKDIDKRSFVFALGIDKSNEKDRPFRVTLKLALPTQKIEPSTDNTQLVSETSETISGAVRLIAAQLDKELDFGQTKIYLLGEGLAKDNIQEALDWLSRKRDFQMEGYMALGKPTAEAVLRIKPKSEQFPGNALILSFGESGSESPYALTEFLYDFYRRTTEQGMDPYLPVIETNTDVYFIKKVALLDKNKIKTILTADESRIFKELLRSYTHFNFDTKLDETHLVMSVQKFKRKYSFETDKQAAPTLHVKIQMRGIAEESQKKLYNQDWSRIEKQIEEDETLRFHNLLKKLQKNKVDPLGFGLLYRATHNKREKDWEDWQHIYPNLQFDVSMKVSMRGTGLIK